MHVQSSEGKVVLLSIFLATPSIPYPCFLISKDIEFSAVSEHEKKWDVSFLPVRNSVQE
jgi:hypothetical protein